MKQRRIYRTTTDFDISFYPLQISLRRVTYIILYGKDNLYYVAIVYINHFKLFR